jgi:hypothetical protein
MAFSSARKWARLVLRTSQGQASEITSLGKLPEQLLHFTVDALGIAERALTLRDTNGPGLAGPGVDVLEQVPVNGAVVRVGEQS